MSPAYRSLVSRASLFALAALALGSTAIAQTAVGTEFQVNSYTPSHQRYPSVASSASGDFVVAWMSYLQDGDSRGVFAQRFSSAGVALATELQVNTYTTHIQSQPAVAADAAGGFVVAWNSFGQDGDSNGIFARRFSNTGDPLATEFQVNSYTSGGQDSASVAATAAGDFVVAWSSYQDGDNRGVFARRFSNAGDPLATEFQVNTFTSGSQRRPSPAASAASGDFAIVWDSAGQDGSTLGVFAQRFSSAGARLATEFQVNSFTAAEQYRASAAMDADGDFVVAWHSHFQVPTASLAIFAQRFSSAGIPLGAEFQVSTFTAGGQIRPSVAADSDGDFVIAWVDSSQDGADYGVFARRFSSTGVPLTAELQVNTYTTGDQAEPRVAADAHGNFVVAWSSVEQDGSSYGIFGQRFSVPITVDVDGDGTFAPLTDGLLLLRYAFGFRGATLITGAVNLAGCTRCDAAAIEVYLASIS